MAFVCDPSMIARESGANHGVPWSSGHPREFSRVRVTWGIPGSQGSWLLHFLLVKSNGNVFLFFSICRFHGKLQNVYFLCWVRIKLLQHVRISCRMEIPSFDHGCCLYCLYFLPNASCGLKPRASS